MSPRTRAPTLKREDDRKEPGPWEKAFMASSALVTLALLGFLLHRAIAAPEDGPPEARILAVEPGPGGDVVAVVEATNPAKAGLLVLEVEVACGEKPYPSVTFENVPAGGKGTARVLCPAEGPPPEARVVHYVEA